MTADDWTNHDLIAHLARRANVTHADAEALLRALNDLENPSALPGKVRSYADDVSRAAAAPTIGPLHYDPSAAEIDALIAAASEHPLGLSFLLEGHPEAVAITFGAHAFTVEAARQRLGRRES